MRVEYQASLAAVCGLVFSGNSLAQSPCDCTSIIGSCSASVTVQNSFIEVTSDTPQCARVDYVVDGTPFVSLVVDGAARQDRTVQSSSPSVIVQSCQICLANTAAADAPDFGAGLYSAGEATRLIEVAPAYPAEALAAGIEGFVDVRFTISPSGVVNSPEIAEANPEGVFEEAALAAVSRWRYTGNLQGEPVTVTERLEFTLSDELFSLRPNSGAASRPLPVTEPVRNHCIQEESRYDFGAVVDVSLINACEDALIVYSCAAGTGANHELWTCQNPRGSGSALGASASSRLELTRAPNGEYWWLACDVDDAACLSDGRQWIRSLDGQTATINPQNRTRAQLARSY
jgi:TonB family protein